MGVLYLSILGLKSGASEGEVKAAFRAKAKIFHPDYGGDSEKFSRIWEAYQFLLKNGTGYVSENTGTKKCKEGNFGKSTSPFKGEMTCPYCKGGKKVPGSLFDSFMGMDSRENCRFCGGNGSVSFWRTIPEGKKICTDCNGFGKVFDSPFPMPNSFSTCGRCRGKGLEFDPSSYKGNKTSCRMCGGLGRKKDAMLGNLYERCGFCQGTGFESIQVSIKPGTKHCPDCNGFGKRWEMIFTFGTWRICVSCRGKGLIPR